jgi:hypothetical protein
MITIEKPLDEIESWDPGSSGSCKPGMHEVVIDEVKLEDAQSGYQKVNLKLRVVAGESVGGTVYANKSLHPNALPYFRGMLDVLNCYATTKNLDEQKLKGKYLRVFVEEVPKSDNSGKMTLKVDKMFVSEINADKNLPTDISEGAKLRPAPPHASAPAQRSVAAGGKSVTGGGNGKATPAPEKIDDLPF